MRHARLAHSLTPAASKKRWPRDLESRRRQPASMHDTHVIISVRSDFLNDSVLPDVARDEYWFVGAIPRVRCLLRIRDLLGFSRDSRTVSMGDRLTLVPLLICR